MAQHTTEKDDLLCSNLSRELLVFVVVVTMVVETTCIGFSPALCGPDTFNALLSALLQHQDHGKVRTGSVNPVPKSSCTR